MGYVIGDNAIGISTWGSLRRAVSQGATPTVNDHNVTYGASSGFFKSEEGNKLIAGALTSALARAEPTATVNSYGASVFAFVYLDVRYESVLTGQSVTTDLAETFTIDASAFSSPYQTTTPTVIGTAIDDIGLFDPVA
ncbi:MAG: hypothetical protein RI910_246 [Verrucomicrobiota bacterium]|jgi:hypothetical protein